VPSEVPSRRSLALKDRIRLWWRIGWKLGLVLLILAGVLKPWITYTYWKSRVRREIGRLNGMALCQNRIGGRSLGGLEFEFGPLDNVYFLGPQVNDENLEILGVVPELRVLSLANSRVSDEGLAQLGRFRRLNCLYIGNTDYVKFIGPSGAKLNTTPVITGKGLVALKDLPNLEVVQLVGPQTTDRDLRALGALKHLVFVDLVSTSSTDAGVAELKKALPNCKVTRR
jgi:hypothetical protein